MALQAGLKMKAQMTRRLGRVETKIGARVGTDYTGAYETHFTEAWPKDDYDGALARCPEHGPGCLVQVTPVRSMSLRRIIIVASEPCELG
jgi:hypothetical protein